MELQVTPVMPLFDTVLLPECQDAWETEGCSQPPATDTFLNYLKGVLAITCCTSMLSASAHYRVLICMATVLVVAQNDVHT